MDIKFANFFTTTNYSRKRTRQRPKKVDTREGNTTQTRTEDKKRITEKQRMLATKRKHKKHRKQRAETNRTNDFTYLEQK